MTVSGASSADNAMLQAVRELTSEVRACREVFMAIVSPPKLLSSALILTFTSITLSPRTTSASRKVFPGSSQSLDLVWRLELGFSCLEEMDLSELEMLFCLRYPWLDHLQ
jgi:hypothetical protein